jgi:hypothetical protein
MFWNKPSLPLTANDKEWTEDALLWIVDQFGAGFLKTVSIKTPTTKYFNRKYKGTEEDVEFILERICEYMSVDRASVYLSFYGHPDIAQDHNLPHNVRSDKTPAGKYQEWPEGYIEISLNLKELKDPISVISTLAHEVAHAKLLGERRIAENDEPLTDLLTVAFGFGIFTGNAIFKMEQWSDSRMQGWSMKRKGYLPEQIVSYAMAWMAKYQGDTACVWTTFFSDTMLSYFEKCRLYISKYPENIRFERKPGDRILFAAPTAEPAKAEETISYDQATFEKPDSDALIEMPAISGTWSGVLIYGKGYLKLRNEKLFFTIEFSETEEGEFEGVARDTSGAGLNPHEATVKGFLEGKRISFIKQYKSNQIEDKDSKLILEKGHPGPEINYSGSFNSSTGAFEGEWTIDNSYISMGKKKEYTCSGIWTMKKAPDD